MQEVGGVDFHHRPSADRTPQVRPGRRPIPGSARFARLAAGWIADFFGTATRRIAPRQHSHLTIKPKLPKRQDRRAGFSILNDRALPDPTGDWHHDGLKRQTVEVHRNALAPLPAGGGVLLPQRGFGLGGGWSQVKTILQISPIDRIKTSRQLVDQITDRLRCRI